MTSKEFLKECRSGALRGVYLFIGDEEYMKNHCLHAARKALFGDEEDDPFNRTVLSGENDDFLFDLAEQTAAMPMFAEKRMIELHAVNYPKLSRSDLDMLIPTLEELKDSEDTVLILYAEKDEFDAGQLPKRPSALYKSFEPVSKAVIFDYEPPYALAQWVCRHFAAAGVECSPDTAEKLVAYCSRDMYTLAGEAEKLICYTLSAGRKTADPRDIETVCCGKSIDGAFDFTNALMRGDAANASRLLTRMKEKRVKSENILGGVIDTLSGMYAVKVLRDEGLSQDEIASKLALNPYRVKNFDLASKNKKVTRLEGALKLCMEADLKIKSSPIDDYTVLDRLVVRLCRV